MNPLGWLDGKKTVIGAIALFAGAFIDEVLIDKWGVTWDRLESLGSTFDWFGMVMGGTGLAHRYAKGKASGEPPAENP